MPAPEDHPEIRRLTSEIRLRADMIDAHPDLDVARVEWVQQLTALAVVLAVVLAARARLGTETAHRVGSALILAARGLVPACPHPATRRH